MNITFPLLRLSNCAAKYFLTFFHDNGLNRNFMTPHEAIQKLFQAAKTGRVSDAEAALVAGADPNAVNNRQHTPLHYAAQYGYSDLARLLIDKGAEVNAVNSYQQTPLHYAAQHGYSELARLLIEKAAGINAKNGLQQTPLHLAAQKGQIDIARLLIEKDAEVNARDDHQNTPLHWAAVNGHTELAELLATAERWNAYVKPMLGTDKKLDARQLVDEAGQPTEALKNLLPNDLFAFLARPESYRQGMDGLGQVYPHLPEMVQASIDLTPYRRAKVREASEAAGPDGNWLKRYSRRVAKRLGNDEPQVG
jgi:Ankyrin repeats (3 copies)/Ankyrin repeats (many copies)